MSLVPINEVVFFDGRVHTPATGALVDADSTPTFDVFEENTDTPILASQSMTKRTSLTGKYRGSFTASAANGFEAGKWYTVDMTATVGGVTDSAVVAWFRVAPAEANAGVPLVEFTSAAIASIWAALTSGLTTVGSIGKLFVDNITATLFGKLSRSSQGFLDVVVGAGSTTTLVVLNSSTGINGSAPSAVNDIYNGRALILTVGSGAPQATSVTGYTASTKTLTVVALAVAPVAGDLGFLS